MGNSIDNNELHLYTELHYDEQMLMFRPTMARGPVTVNFDNGRGSVRSCSASRASCFWATRCGLPVAAREFRAHVLCVDTSNFERHSTTLLPKISVAAARRSGGRVHPPGGKQGLTAVLGSLACGRPEASLQATRRAWISHR